MIIHPLGVCYFKIIYHKSKIFVKYVYIHKIYINMYGILPIYKLCVQF